MRRGCYKQCMNFTIRPATPDDAAAIARIHIAGWRAAYDGMVSDGFLDGLDEAQRAADWQNWIGEGKTHVQIAHDENNNAAGFIGFGPLRTPPPGMSQIRPLYSSEIYALYILPDYWRQKLGTQLMAAAATQLRALRHRSFCLWVVENNKRAVNFYKARGGQRCGKKEVEIGGAQLIDIAMGWRDMSVLLPAS